MAPPEGFARRCTPPHHFLQSAGRRPPRFSLAPHLDSEPYHQAHAIHAQVMRTHHCESRLFNSRSITILPPATENVTRLATNKRFANVQLTTTTTTVPRYLLSCWLKRSAHLFALLSGQKYNESARQTNTSQNTASAVWQNGGPSRQGDYHSAKCLVFSVKSVSCISPSSHISYLVFCISYFVFRISYLKLSVSYSTRGAAYLKCCVSRIALCFG